MNQSEIKEKEIAMKIEDQSIIEPSKEETADKKDSSNKN